MSNFDESDFKRRVDEALKTVATLLENERNPTFAADVPHRYEDKYLLAEVLTNTSLAAQLNVLSWLGVGAKELATLREWSKTRSVTLRLSAEERCAFDREETRKEESPKHVVKVKATTGLSAKASHKVVTKVTEYFWKFNGSYTLSAFAGTDSSDGLVLRERAGQVEIKTSANNNPHHAVHVIPSMDVNVTWMLQQIAGSADENTLNFGIQRQLPSCATPRRNVNVETALSNFASFRAWAHCVSNYFLGGLFSKQQHTLNMSAITSSSIFVPVLPLFEKRQTDDDDDEGESKAASSSSAATASSSSSSSSSLPINLKRIDDDEAAILGVNDANRFLAEQLRAHDECVVALTKTFPADDGKLINVAEAALLVAVKHGADVVDAFKRGVDYIEHMLYEQLIAAIGKVVSPVDFAEYMRFHNRKLFKTAYQPSPFAYAVRRHGHCPEGTLSIESSTSDGAVAEPIYSTVRASQAGTTPMQFALSASTNVRFFGQRYVHAYVMNSFAGASGQKLALTARARQFSSFILLVGRIASARDFEPTGAIIVQNKDDLKVLLDMETIPTPKEFRDAIESLSPEQQAFAKAYRAMQLESTLFGVAVVQIKPQLERLLKLDDDSLTKEIALGQDLLELFIDYQLPSDLLTYDGPVNASTADKLRVVKGYVANMKQMIDDQKQEELKKKAEEKKMRELAQSLAVREGMAMGGAGGGGGGAPGGPPMQFRSRAASPLLMACSMASSSAAPRQLQQQQQQPQQQQQQQQQPQKTQTEPKTEKPTQAASSEDAEEDDPTLEDYTKIPATLDKQFEKLDVDSALRPTIIKPAKTWTLRYKETLLSDVASKSLNVDAQKRERERAFDLLDALSRSGSLDVEHAELHIVIAATHCFAKSIIDTVVQDNVNPIEKVERSTLIVATTIQQQTVEELVKPDQYDRLKSQWE